MNNGIKNGYSWFQTSEEDFRIEDFRREFGRQMIGKFVYVTALDSIPVTLSSNEKIEGWRTTMEIAISPAIDDQTTIPSGDFSEWYIFDSGIVELDVKQKFVNIFDFDLREDSIEVNDFWKTIERSQPVIYISEGNRLTIVTSDDELVRKIESHWR